MNKETLHKISQEIRKLESIVDCLPKSSNNNRMPITKISSDRNSNKHIRPSNSDLGNSLTLATTSNPNEEFCIPELEAWFIEIAHSDGNTFIVNSECLVEHILLHLKHKFLGKEPLFEDVLIENPVEDFSQLSAVMVPHESPSGNNRSNLKRNSHKTQNTTASTKNETTWWFLDLVCQETGNPLDLVNKPKREYLSRFVKGRQKFYLSKIRKNMYGTIREIVTLSTDIPLDILDKIESHVKALVEKRRRESTALKGKKKPNSPTKGSSNHSLKIKK